MMADQLKQAQQSATGVGEEKWNQMSEEQKKATYVDPPIFLLSPLCWNRSGD